MTLIDPLWDRLPGIRTCEFTAHSRSIRATGWTGSGSGVVAVESSSPTVLIFRESGSWHTAEGRRLRFSNVYRWTRQDAAVRLEHLRFGAERPVYLFDLSPSPGGAWASLSPHLCGEDTYAAQLRLESHGLVLSWTVTGPEKQEEIEYIYSTA